MLLVLSAKFQNFSHNDINVIAGVIFNSSLTFLVGALKVGALKVVIDNSITCIQSLPFWSFGHSFRSNQPHRRSSSTDLKLPYITFMFGTSYCFIWVSAYVSRLYTF